MVVFLRQGGGGKFFRLQEGCVEEERNVLILFMEHGIVLVDLTGGCYGYLGSEA